MPRLDLYIADLSPQRCLVPCATCGATVITQTWHHATKHEGGHYTQAAALDPVCGLPHACPQAAQPEKE